MEDILQDYSTASLKTAIEENTLTLMPEIKKWSKATVHDSPEVKWAITDIPSLLVNFVIGARLKPEQTDETIQTVIAKVKERKVPIMWWTGPNTQPADLGERLEKHGFVSAGESPGMAADLINVKDDLSSPDGLTVQLVDDKDSLKQWCQVLGAGFEMPEFVTDAYMDYLSLVDPAKALSYLGKVDDQPVAISQVYFGAGVAGIYCVATIPEARRQGLGAFMTLVPMQEAKKHGYKIAILHASKMGLGVYQSLGFREYCKIGHYVWSPEESKEERP